MKGQSAEFFSHARQGICF